MRLLSRSPLLLPFQTNTRYSKDSTYGQENELARLRRVEVDHARLKLANKTKKIIGAVCGIATAIGGAMLKYSTATEGVAAGWAFIFVAALTQLIISVFDG